jgi:hypothetical protein
LFFFVFVSPFSAFFFFFVSASSFSVFSFPFVSVSSVSAFLLDRFELFGAALSLSLSLPFVALSVSAFFFRPVRSVEKRKTETTTKSQFLFMYMCAMCSATQQLVSIKKVYM